jgi:hypothetical protein
VAGKRSEGWKQAADEGREADAADVVVVVVTLVKTPPAFRLLPVDRHRGGGGGGGCGDGSGDTGDGVEMWSKKKNST